VFGWKFGCLFQVGLFVVVVTIEGNCNGSTGNIIENQKDFFFLLCFLFFCFCVCFIERYVMGLIFIANSSGW